MQDRADTLRNNQYRAFFCLFLQSSSQCDICLIIQRRETVVENIQIRMFCDCPGYGETLFLST